MAAPVTIKLRCASWRQLSAIYKRDLSRSSLFLKSKSPPPLGTEVRISLTLPSQTVINLAGQVAEHIASGGLDGRGPGVDIRLHTVPHTAMWLIETALSSAQRETSAATPLNQGAARQARAQQNAPPTVVPGRLGSVTGDISIEDGDDLASAEQALLGALQQELEALRRLNAFQLLGVGYEADDQKVRDAFGLLTKRYHPDRYARYESEEVRELAAEIFILIRDAYRRIGSVDGRAQVRAKIDAARSGARPAATSRPVSTTPEAPAGSGRAPAPHAVPAPPVPRPAPRAVTPPPVPGPLPAAPPPGPPPGPAPAADAAPTAASAPRSSTQTLLDAGRYDEALAVYKLRCKRDPDDLGARAGIELAEGLKALAQRDRLEAAQRFESVLEIDPTNERAARELAEMRRQATNERKGLLARLLGKKE